MIDLKQIFHEVGPKTKSRGKVVHDIKKVKKHRFMTFLFIRSVYGNLLREDAKVPFCKLHGTVRVKSIFCGDPIYSELYQGTYFL